MRRLGLALAIWASLSLAAAAQVGGLMFPGPGAPAATGGGYTGPGDVATFVAWYSTGRGYSAAYASPGTNKAFRVCDVATGLTCFDALVQTNGKVNQAAVVASSACTSSCKYTILYDQSGNSRDLPATAGTATFSANTLASLPCLILSGTQSFGGIAYTQAQPFTESFYANNGAGANSPILAEDSCCSGPTLYLHSGNAGVFTGTADQTVAAADGSYHAVQMAVNGASTAINVDGSDSTVASTPGGAGFSSHLDLGKDGFGNLATATMCEAGLVASAVSSTVRGQLATNQAGFW